MILDWAESSSTVARKASRSSHDKPGADYHDLDFNGIRRALYTIAPLQQRNYVVMEVRNNLMADERKALLNRFGSSAFRTRALVMAGEPPAEFKKVVQQMTLKAKQEASDKA